MPLFRTKDQDEAAEFIRNLEGRGYILEEYRSARGGIIPTGNYRLYIHRGWFRITYHEPEILVEFAEPDESRRGANDHKGARPMREECKTEGCDLPERHRGLCANCYARWRYWRARGMAA